MRRQNEEEAARVKGEPQQSIRHSKREMRSDWLENFWGAEVWVASHCANLLAGVTVEALTDREGRQANTSLEKEEMLRDEYFPPNDGN